jgi:predicted MFS family arabinose efflux permease
MVRGIQATPFLFRSPVTGSVADRYPWKFLVVGAVRQWLHSHGHRRVILFGLIRSSHVYVTALLMACVQVLPSAGPRRHDLRHVPAETQTNAIGLNAVVFNMARSTGRALAGVLISVFNRRGVRCPRIVFFFWRPSGPHKM